MPQGSRQTVAAADSTRPPGHVSVAAESAAVVSVAKVDVPAHPIRALCEQDQETQKARALEEFDSPARIESPLWQHEDTHCLAETILVDFDVERFVPHDSAIHPLKNYYRRVKFLYCPGLLCLLFSVSAYINPSKKLCNSSLRDDIFLVTDL